MQVSVHTRKPARNDGGGAAGLIVQLTLTTTAAEFRDLSKDTRGYTN